mmetsp:Transcript_64969/g.155151  ORF Transcript_64969/g.155151 Transcript_64969/m.155151 type:complete len:207 (+) Transcript_64969:575-1195(+)
MTSVAVASATTPTSSAQAAPGPRRLQLGAVSSIRLQQRAGWMPQRRPLPGIWPDAQAWQRREASRWTRCQCLPEVQGLQLRTPCERSVLAGTCHHALAWQQGLKWLGDSGSHACAQAPRTQLAVISAPQIASGQTWLLASCGWPRVRGRSRTMMVAERLGQLQILGAAQSLTRLLILFVKQEGGRTPRWQGPPYVKSPPTRHANGR